MKKDKNNCYVLAVIIIVICYVTTSIASKRSLDFGIIKPNASLIVYPITFFLITLFSERYGKGSEFYPIIYSIISLLIMSLLLSLSGALPASGEILPQMFNVNYRIVISSIITFYLFQTLNLKIYYYLEDKNKTKRFFISSIITVTLDCIAFTLLSHIGEVTTIELLKMMTSQYICDVIIMTILVICFNNLIPSIETAKKKDKA